MTRNIFGWGMGRGWIVILLGLALSGAMAVQGAWAVEDDAYLHGYVSALLTHGLELEAISVTVQDGVVYLRNVPADEATRQRVLQAVRKAPDVRRVEIAPAANEDRLPFTEQDVDESTEGLFPPGDLFEPLLADPTESRFFLGYRYTDLANDSIGVGSLGEVFGLYRWENVFGPDQDIQLNFEGNAIGYFNLSEQADIFSTDFHIGFPIVYRYQDFASRFRVMHRSGHIGDEYIFDNPQILNIPIDDRNVSDNYVDWVQSYGPDGWRVYGGARYIWDPQPERDKWELLFGGEYRPWPHLSIHPVMGAHFLVQEEFDWVVNQRYVAGVEVSNWPFRNRTLQFLLEYYEGKEIALPFYRQDGDYIGFGIYMDL